MLFECVPNVSEGRDPGRIRTLVEAVSAADVTVLDVSSDRDHHRTVLTLAGESDPLIEALLSLYDASVRDLSLNRHRGVHPRIGLVDVVPFIPLTGATLADAVSVAERLGERVAARFAMPVLLYGAAARQPQRRELAPIRRGGLEGLAARLADVAANANHGPDFGPRRLHPTAGATVIGARHVLIAFNVVLDTDDLVIARRVAARVREKGGGLASVRALGLPLAERERVQVSMNLLDYRLTKPIEAFRRIEAESARWGVSVLDSEIVGLVPAAALAPGDAAVLHLGAYGVLEDRLAASGR